MPGCGYTSLTHTEETEKITYLHLKTGYMVFLTEEHASWLSNTEQEDGLGFISKT